MTDALERIAEAARSEGGVFAATLRDDPVGEPIWHELCRPGFLLGLEAIYEGYLLHYAQPRLFRRDSLDDAILCGDFLYARGLVWIAEQDDPRAVAELAELIAVVSSVRVDAPRVDRFALWAATALALGEARDAGPLEAARRALAEHGDGAPLEVLLAGRDVSRERAAHVRFDP